MIGALSFLTVVGRGRTPTATDVAWFPFVGLLIGLVLGGVWVGANEVWPPVLAATIVVAVDLALTGMLHLDGLADSADGLLPHMEQERRLDVMRQPDVGAFGVGAVAVVLALRVAALASTDPRFLVPTVLWCTSRTVMAIGLQAVPYARAGGGLATAFEGGRRPAFVQVVVGLPVAVAIAATWIGLPGIIALAGALLGGMGVVALGRARLGGYTGDVLGAAGMIAETVGLVVIAARW